MILGDSHAAVSARYVRTNTEVTADPQWLFLTPSLAVNETVCGAEVEIIILTYRLYSHTDRFTYGVSSPEPATLSTSSSVLK